MTTAYDFTETAADGGRVPLHEFEGKVPKFLIGRDGEVIKRYEPPVLPADIKADLERYL